MQLGFIVRRGIKVRSDGLSSAYAALSAAVLFWGFSFVATKVALETFPTFTLIFARFSLASCVFLLLAVLKGLPRFSGRDHGKLFLMALFEPGLYFVFETMGLQRTTAPKAALIIATIPVAVLVFARVLIGERISLISLLGICTSLAGIAILITGDPTFSWSLGGHLLGDLFIVGAVITAALYMVAARDLGKNHSAWNITSCQTFYGALFFAPLFLWEARQADFVALSARSVGAVLYLTFFATVAAFLFYNYALTKVAASRAAVFVNGIPVVATFGAWVVLGERLTALQAAGGVMVLLGVWLTNALAKRSGTRQRRSFQGG